MKQLLNILKNITVNAVNHSNDHRPVLGTAEVETFAGVGHSVSIALR